MEEGGETAFPVADMKNFNETVSKACHDSLLTINTCSIATCTHTHAHTHTKRKMKGRMQMKLIDENIIENIAILAYGSCAR